MDLALILSGLSLISCAVFWIYAVFYLKRRTGQEHILAEFREEINKLIAEIDAATDRDSILVEERINHVKALLEELDKRISTHARELSRSQLPAIPPNASKKEAETLTIRVSHEQINTALPLAEQAVALSKAGIATTLIANRLGMTIAEVELALTLSSKK
jgi:hypothetical protein